MVDGEIGKGKAGMQEPEWHGEGERGEDERWLDSGVPLRLGVCGVVAIEVGKSRWLFHPNAQP